MESLQGTFLLATNEMQDPRFVKSVILICFHEAGDGAMGLVVNQPLTDVDMYDILHDFNQELDVTSLPPVYYGGPVEMESAFILHSDDYISVQSRQVMEQVYLSQDPGLLMDVAHGKGPAHYLLALGYTGWGPGQLEQELCGAGWLSLPARAGDLFLLAAPDMWEKVAARYGIDMHIYRDIQGTA